MSELTNKVRRMLSQAQGFVVDAPLEAVSRTKQALSAAKAGLETATGAERDDLLLMVELASNRLPRYEQAFEAWSSGVRERAELFHEHEVERLQQPLPPKV